MPVSFGVLGPLEARRADGGPAPLGVRQRRLLALLLAHHGRAVGSDALAEVVFADRPPANPTAALQSQVSRLRRTLGADVVHRTPDGYRAGDASTDAGRFEALVEQGRRDPEKAAELLGEALALWRGPAYGEFDDVADLALEGNRLDELRRAATEERAAALVASGRAAEAVPDLESFVAANPLREHARAALMRALYATGRHVDALEHYTLYRRHLADELGLEPSVALQRLELDILRHGLDQPAARVPAALDRMVVRYVHRHDGHPIAVTTVGEGAPVLVVPAWVTSLELIAAGRDLRASLVENLARRARVTLYDRLGTGLSRGPAVPDHGLAAAAAELESVLEQVTGPAAVFGASVNDQVIPPGL